MSEIKYKTMGQQFGRRSWAEPWKIKMVEPIHLLKAEGRKAAIQASRIQYLFTQIGRSLYRFTHRQWHQRDE